MHPASREPLCIYPVSYLDARRWLAGELRDIDLALRSSLVPEAIYWQNLPDVGSLLAGIRALRMFWDQGARCVIARSAAGPFLEQVRRHGAILAYNDPGTQDWRYIMPEDPLRAILHRQLAAIHATGEAGKIIPFPQPPAQPANHSGMIDQNAVAASGVTISR